MIIEQTVNILKQILGFKFIIIYNQTMIIIIIVIIRFNYY